MGLYKHTFGIERVILFALIFQFGAFIVYFFDYTIGSGWWLMILYVMQLCAIFVVRGKPYSGEHVVSVLITKANFCASWLSPLLAFSWHVVSISTSDSSSNHNFSPFSSVFFS